MSTDARPKAPSNPAGYIPFIDMERLARGDHSAQGSGDRRPVLIASGFHLFILLLLVLPISSWLFWGDDSPLIGEIRIRFPDPAGSGRGGGGGGGGSGGERMTAYIPTVLVPKPADPDEQPRLAAIAPRIPRPLNFDALRVPDLVDEPSLLDSVYSPDAVVMPGLSLTNLRDHGGVDTERSSGTGRGVGGGEGTGVGTGEGWGVGPGRGGGFGGGDYSPGRFDMEPELVFKPPEPAYPPQALERQIYGEVILQILVRLDGSTEVLSVVKSLPYCVSAARENAKLWRWKPGLLEGKPVETVGIITVNFSRFAH